MKKLLSIILSITMLFSMTAVAFADETTDKETISAAKAKLIEASGDPYPSAYMLVDNAILGLKKDGTILKLIEKYELNSGINNDENYKITYSSTVTIEDTQSSGRPTPTIPSIPGGTSEEIAINRYNLY